MAKLSDLGLSTRAIAPTVGVDHSTAVRDLRKVVQSAPPESNDYSLRAPDYEDKTKLQPILTVEHHDIEEQVDVGIRRQLHDLRTKRAVIHMTEDAMMTPSAFATKIMVNHPTKSL